MDREKINKVMCEVADKLSEECKKNGVNTERILFLAKALKELAEARSLTPKMRD